MVNVWDLFAMQNAVTEATGTTTSTKCQIDIIVTRNLGMIRKTGFATWHI